MAEIGKLYVLAIEHGVSSYAMSDTYDVSRKRSTDWIPAETFQNPFILIDQHGKDWIKVLVGDKTGWINAGEDQLRLIKPYK